MSRPALTFSLRKTLSVQLGDAAGKEIADLIQRLTDRIEHLEKSKVDVTPIFRVAPAENSERPRHAA
jgi:hypothetical protein